MGGFSITMAPTLRKYLMDQGIRYELIRHEPTMSSLGSAHAGHLPSSCVAKGIVLNNGDSYVLAVLPASHHLRLPDLRLELGQEVHLASEPEVEAIFHDCERGAVPPVG